MLGLYSYVIWAEKSIGNINFDPRPSCDQIVTTPISERGKIMVIFDLIIFIQYTRALLCNLSREIDW